MSELLRMRIAREELHRACTSLYAHTDGEVARSVHGSFLKYEAAVLEVVATQNEELIALAERLERAEAALPTLDTQQPTTQGETTAAGGEL